MELLGRILKINNITKVCLSPIIKVCSKKLTPQFVSEKRVHLPCSFDLPQFCFQPFTINLSFSKQFLEVGIWSLTQHCRPEAVSHQSRKYSPPETFHLVEGKSGKIVWIGQWTVGNDVLLVRIEPHVFGRETRTCWDSQHEHWGARKFVFDLMVRIEWFLNLWKF